jgi:hypothetical protein
VSTPPTDIITVHQDRAEKMTDNVVTLRTITKLDIPADRVLAEASKAGLTSVMVIGYDADGDEYFASSIADGGTCLWLMERMKKQLME